MATWYIVVKHTQTIRWLLPTNCFSVLGHFVELAFKGLDFRNGYVGLLILHDTP